MAAEEAGRESSSSSSSSSRPSDQSYSPMIGIRHCTVLGIVGFIGTNIEKGRDGKYTATDAFQKRIQKRNLFAFS